MINSEFQSCHRAERQIPILLRVCGCVFVCEIVKLVMLNEDFAWTARSVAWELIPF